MRKKNQSIWETLIKTPPSFWKNTFFFSLDGMKNTCQSNRFLESKERKRACKSEKKIIFISLCRFCSKCFEIRSPYYKLIEHSDWFPTKLANNLWHFPIVGFCSTLKWAFFSFQSWDVRAPFYQCVSRIQRKKIFHYQCKNEKTDSSSQRKMRRERNNRIFNSEYNYVTCSDFHIHTPFESPNDNINFQTEVRVSNWNGIDFFVRSRHRFRLLARAHSIRIVFVCGFSCISWNKHGFSF